ncbi:hypothetical protein [Selenomonas sp. oral taxon 478]|uniref:hypothetical protein n=1 Tax=Selenomonas sp. oral taxon 478 TaxID=712538 RepID=UPI00067A18E6|nr:hypothetical protein [Selenomonas sp. oral taxon 478]AKT54653.1 hypothetical protein ADJ74_09480 [Selenomonas sp. oral taxon 478]
MFEEMFKDEESASTDHGVRLVCADESVFSALAHYYSRVEECESRCGMPVRLFYPEVEQEHEVSASTDEVSWRNTMLISDVQAKGLTTAVLKDQDVICVYRTDSKRNFAACAERLTALQENGGDGCARPAVLCFADADTARAYICGSGLWAPRQSQVVGATWDDVLPLLASTKGNLRWISGEILPWEEMPVRNSAARDVQLIFRGSTDLSMFEVMEKSEAIAGCFADGVNVLWQIEVHDKNEILVFVAQPMS